MSITDMEGWTKVEKIYRSMRIYNVLFMNCMQMVIGPFICTASAALLLMLYVCVRPSGLPLLIHASIPFLTFVSLVTFSWLWYDVVLVKRSGQEILDSLQSKSHRFLWSLGPTERVYVFQRARALRPVSLTIGQFSDATLRGLVGLLDEIVNQLLFCLSL